MQYEKDENQAEKLQQLFEEVNNQPIKKDHDNQRFEQDYIEIDVLNLPPRREVHTNPKSRLSISFKRPVVRITIVFILLIAILTTIYLLMGDQLFSIL